MARIFCFSLIYLGVMVMVSACAQAPVQSSVDSSGEGASTRGNLLFFASDQADFEDAQTLKECRRAAQDLGLKVSEQKCSGCAYVQIKTKVTAGETVLTSSPTLMSSGGMFGDERSLGLGLASRESVKSKILSSREIFLTLFQEADRVKPTREISVKSAGKEANVSAVAYAMCKAAFTDYPENIKNRRYEIKQK